VVIYAEKIRTEFVGKDKGRQVNFTLEKAMTTQTGHRGIALLFL
jgi:hypothetical protein